MSIDEHLVCLTQPSSWEADNYRALLHTLDKRCLSGVLGITSPMPGDGKTTTSINLAAVISEIPNTRVLLVDADLRCGSVGEKLGMEAGVGLADAVRGLTLDEVLRQEGDLRFSIITAGAQRSSPHQLIRSPRLGELLVQARTRYDVIVLDMTPAWPVPDGRAIAAHCDAMLMVVAAHHTPRGLLTETLETIDRDKLAGLVFNREDEGRRDRRRYYPMELV